MHSRISGARIAANVTTIVAHVLLVALLLVPVGSRGPAPHPDDAESVIEVTYITYDPPAPPPPPPPKRPPPPVPPPPEPAPVSVPDVQTHVAQEEVEPTEVFQMPAFQPPDIEDEVVEEGVAGLSAEMFDAMAHGGEPNPDWEPTELLSFRTSHPPRYPPESRRNGEKGWVVLRVLVGEEGQPLRYAIDARTTATERLIQAAIEAVDQWRFNPAIKDGRPVAAWMVVPIGFFISQRQSRAPAAPQGEDMASNES